MKIFIIKNTIILNILVLNAWADKLIVSNDKDAINNIERVKKINSTQQYGEVYGLDPRGDGFLSIRKKPKGREIAKLYNGSKVKILGKKGKWYKVKDVQSAKTGWSHSNWIQKINSNFNVFGMKAENKNNILYQSSIDFVHLKNNIQFITSNNKKAMVPIGKVLRSDLLSSKNNMHVKLSVVHIGSPGDVSPNKKAYLSLYKTSDDEAHGDTLASFMLSDGLFAVKLAEQVGENIYKIVVNANDGKYEPRMFILIVDISSAKKAIEDFYNAEYSYMGNNNKVFEKKRKNAEKSSIKVTIRKGKHVKENPYE